MANKQAYEIPSFYIGVLEANIDMSALQYTVVEAIAASGSGVVGPAALGAPAAGAAGIGILQNNPQLAEAGQVMVHGVTKAKLAGSVSIGNILMTNSSGALLLATSTNFGVAKALQAGASGEYISVLLYGYGKQ